GPGHAPGSQRIRAGDLVPQQLRPARQLRGSGGGGVQVALRRSQRGRGDERGGSELEGEKRIEFAELLEKFLAAPLILGGGSDSQSERNSLFQKPYRTPPR